MVTFTVLRTFLFCSLVALTMSAVATDLDQADLIDSGFSLQGMMPLQMQFEVTKNRTHPGITGCFYTVKSTDTLHHMVNIPCPGSYYYQYTPLHIAGCFFEYELGSSDTSLKALVDSEPLNLGPFSMAGIWIANYQALFIDLTAADNFTVGQTIFLPTCGHSGSLKDMIPVETPATGCGFRLPDGDDEMPLMVMAFSMDVTMEDILYRNPDLSATDTITPGGQEGGVHEVNIPCPG
eukprot:gene29060-32265_t